MNLKNIFLSAIFAALTIISLSCAQEEPDGPTVFNNVTLMGAEKSGSTITFPDVPDEAVELIVGIFNGTEINVNSENVITNTDWIGGNRTGLNDGMDRNSSTKYFSYNSSTKDFNVTNQIFPASGVWAVWGYNSDGIVICSTDKNPW